MFQTSCKFHLDQITKQEDSNRSYASSVLRCLSIFDFFMQDLSKVQVDLQVDMICRDSTLSKTDILEQWINAFRNSRHLSDNAIDSSIFVSLIKKKCFEFDQNGSFDARSFLLILLDSLDEELRFRNTFIIKDTFYGSVEYLSTCNGINLKEEDEFLIFQLDILQFNTMTFQSLLESTKRDCFECLQKHDTKIRFLKHPRIWIFYLNRNWKGNNQDFNHAEINFPVKFCIENIDYHLAAIVHYSSNDKEGHFWSQITLRKSLTHQVMPVSMIESSNDINWNTAYLLFYSSSQINE